MAREVSLVFSIAEANKRRKLLFDKLRDGAVFIYPTDTIYGVGCDASVGKAARRIRELKVRDEKPFSVIAPSKAWIVKNCVVEDLRILDFLPGPFTVIFPLRKGAGIAREVAVGTLGVRMPNHPILDFVKAYKRPVVTTSVNRSGEPNAVELADFDPFPVDFVIYEGKKDGAPSTIIDTVKKRTIVRVRRS